MAQTTVFSCITLIASDIGKLRLKLMEQDANRIWNEVSSPAFSPVLLKPNRYQTRQKFIEQWLVSELSHGNTYVLKERDNRGVVVALYVLDPNRVKLLVATNGDVYYQLQSDNLSGLVETVPAIPASEIIHDRMVCLFHPLVGVSPIFACGLAATQALNIQQNSAKFFKNMSQPGGVLTAPGSIGDDTALRIKKHWEDNYTGEKSGKVAVLGDGLKYEGMAVNAVDAQLVEQLKMSAEQVCSTFHVPPHMVGAAPEPTGTSVGASYQKYYGQCLQALIEAIEASLDEGLGLPNVKSKTLGTEFDLDGLLRMDQTAFVDMLVNQVKGSISKPDEARQRMNLPPIPGGDTIYMQQQNYSLEALSKRDAGDDPFAKQQTSALPASSTEQQDAKEFMDELLKQMEMEIVHAS